MEPPSPLGVVTTTEAGNTLGALLVHVHITGCNWIIVNIIIITIFSTEYSLQCERT